MPPYEGQSRLVLYETFPASDAYLQSRVDAIRARGGQAVDVIVNGDEAKVWIDDTTGELVLGWDIRGKSEVLVANAADFSVEQLIASAESVSDCCG